MGCNGRGRGRARVRAIGCRLGLTVHGHRRGHGDHAGRALSGGRGSGSGRGRNRGCPGSTANGVSLEGGEVVSRVDREHHALLTVARLAAVHPHRVGVLHLVLGDREVIRHIIGNRDTNRCSM